MNNRDSPRAYYSRTGKPPSAVAGKVARCSFYPIGLHRAVFKMRNLLFGKADGYIHQRILIMVACSKNGTAPTGPR